MRSVEYNLELLANMLEEFNDFLLSKETFWPLTGSAQSTGPALPRLSLGQILLILDELQVQADLMAPKQIQQFQQLSEEFEIFRAERPANLEKKAIDEHRQRANLWQAYVVDLREAERAVESYSQDVTHRVLLDRLSTFITDGSVPEGIVAKVEAADAGLRGIFQQGGFIWHPRLKPIYDSAHYWFLYGRPVKQS
jgi:hypothetical protein